MEACLSLCGRGENGFRQFFRFLESPWEGNAAYALLGLVFIPSGPREIPPDDAFYGQGFRLFDQHAPTGKVLSIFLTGWRILRSVR